MFIHQKLLASQNSSKSGQTLIVVIVFVAVATILVLAFVSNVTTELVNENAAESENSAQQLATSAVQLMEGTITYATEPTGTLKSNSNTGSPTGIDTTDTWACQPGMIRTYSTNAVPVNYYKLYSSPNMVVTGNVDPNSTFDGDLPANWNSSPALYCDLNAPVVTPSAATGTTSFTFPIVDPRAADLGVEGFSYGNTTADGAVTIPGVVAASNGNAGTYNAGAFTTDSQSTAAVRLPMPVRWMYVLKDGTMTVPDSGSGTNTAVWQSNTVKPTLANPIVGRIAFWTDDESSKLNINTASEGTYWDTPVTTAGQVTDTFTYPQTAGIGDFVFTNFQAAQNEFQRYPGHPATTCLSTVFGPALTSAGLTRAGLVKAITDTIPRITDSLTASSMGGTSTPSVALTTDIDRLYSSLDEFQFTPSRGAQSLGSSPITSDDIQACGFFLTAHSKAPELNLFGLPRIAIWPLWDDANAAKRTAFDNSILNCATFGAGNNDAHQMAFFRESPLSPQTDWNITQSNGQKRNQIIFNYLLNLMSRNVPGFGGNLVTKYLANHDYQQLLTEIYDYIRSTNLADQSDGTIAHSYTPSSLPATPNLNLATGEVAPTVVTLNGVTTQGIGRIPTISELALVLIKVDDRISTASPEFTQIANPATPATPPMIANEAEVLNIPNFATIYPKGTLNGTPKAGTVVSPANGNAPAGNSQTALEWVLIPKLFCPMGGYTGLGSNLRLQFEIDGLTFTAGGGTTAAVVNATPGTLPDMFTTSSTTTTAGLLNTSAGKDSVIGGNVGMATLAIGGAPAASQFPTGLIVLGDSNRKLTTSATSPFNTSSTATGDMMNISGTIKVTIYSPNVVSGTNLIQTLTFAIGTPISVPMPQINCPPNNSPASAYPWEQTFRWTNSTAAPAVTAQTPETLTFNYPASASTNYKSGTRYAGVSRVNFGLYYASSYQLSGVGLTNSDVIRSFVSNGTTAGSKNLMGDLRLISASANPPSSVYGIDGLETPFGTSPTAFKLQPTGTDYVAMSLSQGTEFWCGAYTSNGQYGWPNQGSPTGVVAMTFSQLKAFEYPPEIPSGIMGVQMTGTQLGVNILPGDWDNGEGLIRDGPLCNKPDEGTSSNNYIGAYTDASAASVVSSVFFSPNRQISSPVMFGSLPIGTDQPWRTPLFRPSALPGYQETAATYYQHPGNDPTVTPACPDHLLLDLFYMPIVDPYSISEPLATSGKINLNTQIAPFTYITRTTGLRGVLKSVMLTAISTTNTSYKTANADKNTATRFPLDLTQTVGQVTTYPDPAPGLSYPTTYPNFSRTTYTVTKPNFFVSASQICDLPLIPQGSTPTTLGTFWSGMALTGDNSLERPYSMIYPRVTTQSNIFTVHVIAQKLQKITGSDPATWTEGTDQVKGEYHGAYTIERYFDPNKGDLSDSAGNILTSANDGALPPTAALRGAKWRLLSVKRVGQ